ncbi:hypothetical protein DITRI_Ditri09bG0041000 [Diplodiscus trichospermus]
MSFDQVGIIVLLESLSFSKNHLDGSIPSAIGNMKSLKALFLYSNNISNFIPSSLLQEIGNLKALSFLDLSQNRLSGPIPTQIGDCSNLQLLNLANIHLSGRIPPQISDLSLDTLNLSHNYISGDIPSQLGSLSSFAKIDLSHNFIGGVIPSQFEKFTQLTFLDLSQNNITGTIPNFPFYLEKFNLSFNSLRSPIPKELLQFPLESFKGNKDLCGEITGFPPCSSSLSPTMKRKRNNKGIQNQKIIIVVPTLFLVSTLALVMVALSRQRARSPKPNPSSTKNGDIFSVWNYDGRIAYEDIIKSTEDFDIKYCIGIRVVAWKKLHHFEAEKPALIEQEFLE